MANVEKVNKPCEDCGVMMENVWPMRRLCHACRKKRQDAYNTRYREEHRAPKTGKQNNKPILNPYAKYCKGCRYWGGGDSCDCCNYIFIEDKRRPCPPGKDCTEYKKGRMPRKRLTLGGMID